MMILPENLIEIFDEVFDEVQAQESHRVYFRTLQYKS